MKKHSSGEKLIHYWWKNNNNYNITKGKKKNPKTIVVVVVICEIDLQRENKIDRNLEHLLLSIYVLYHKQYWKKYFQHRHIQIKLMSDNSKKVKRVDNNSTVFLLSQIYIYVEYDRKNYSYSKYVEAYFPYYMYLLIVYDKKKVSNNNIILQNLYDYKKYHKYLIFPHTVFVCKNTSLRQANCIVIN